MPVIFVNTDNTGSTIYKADKVGKSKAAVEKKMQDTVKALVGKDHDFTTDKSASGKGYTISIEVTKAESSAGKTKYTVRPAIVRFPPSAGKGGKGEEMVSTSVKDLTITVEGNSEPMLLDGIATVTENIVTKSLPLMRVDMARR